MFILLAVALIPPLFQETDEDIRARIRAAVDRLAGADVEDRNRAVAELLKVHVRYAPYIAELGKKLGPESTDLLQRLAVPAPWPELLRGSIARARDSLARIRGGEDRRDPAAISDALTVLSSRPLDDIQRILSALWSSSEAAYRHVAVDGWVRWPPIDLSPVRPLLREPPFAERAAKILLIAGDSAGVPDAVSAYVSGHRAATPVLAQFGVPDADLDRIAAVWKEGLVPQREDFWIVGRRGSEPAARLLAEWIKSASPGRDHAVPVLAWIGDESQMSVVRQWYADHGKDRFVPWPLFDPAAAARRFESLTPQPNTQEFIDKLSSAWNAGPALRDPILARLKRSDLKLNDRRNLLHMLGWAGKAEDSALLLEALADPRLAEAAADALDKMGDPAHARPLFQAYMRNDNTRTLGPAVMSMPADGIEDLLVEVISDADSYPRQATAAVTLAGRNLTPRLRDALLDAYPRSYAFVGAPIEAVLLDPRRVNDAELVAKLKSSKNEGLRAIGSHLEMRAGGKVAVFAGIQSRSLRTWLDSGETAGDAWKEAVAAEWKKARKNPGPPPREMGAWLAERGDEDALDYIRGLLAAPSPTTAMDARAIALGGTAEDVTKAIDLFVDPKLQLERSDPPARLDARIGARMDASTRSRLLGRAREEAPHKPSGNPLRRAVIAAAQMDVNEGRPLYRLVLGLVDYHAGNSQEQVECIHALVRLKDPESLTLFRLQVRSTHAPVRAAAMDALAAFGDRGSALRIARYVDDPTELRSDKDQQFGPFAYRPIRRVWHHAMEALEKITGEKPPAGSVLSRRDFWRAWAGKRR